jgi:DNA adenine methylase
MRHYSDFSAEELGFAFFFLNRTNRSGILNGGMIGGRAQTGKWLIDARYNKDTLISRIENIAEYKHKISIHNMDAKDFLESIIPSLPERSLVYLDPPYYVKGRDLYADHYSHDDHKQISDIIQEQIKQSWVVTYDYCDAIVKFYRKRRCYVYSLGYSAFEYRVGSELMIFCDSIKVPEAAFIRPEDGIAA